jgi:hypothetical protein
MTALGSEKLVLPEKDEFRDAIGQDSLQEKIYKDMVALVKVINEYDHPIAFEYLLHRAYEDYGYSIDPDEQSSFDEHKGRLDKLAKYEESVYSQVVGRIPESDIWIKMALNRIGKDEVSAANLNDVQKTCSKMGDERSEAYHEATKRELQERVLHGVDYDDYPSRQELVDDLIDEVASAATNIIPQRQESMRQGGQSSAGSANEKIASRALENHGLEKGERDSGCNFTTSTNDDADIIVYRKDGNEVPVEVKSTSARERVGRAAPDDNRYWVLFGFFHTTSEVRNGILFKNDQTPAWSTTTNVAYAPPETVSAIDDIDSDSDDSLSAYRLRNDDGQLYLRANNLFPEDMASLNSTGELTDVSPSHEDNFL